jgi:hypothetical protein
VIDLEVECLMAVIAALQQLPGLGNVENQKKVEISCRKQGVKLSWFCALKGSAAVACIHSRLLSCL